MGGQPYGACSDGLNFWFTLDGAGKLARSNSMGRMRVKSLRESVSCLTGYGIDRPVSAAFDGQPALITEDGGQSVSLWKAADLTPLRPSGFCSMLER